MFAEILATTYDIIRSHNQGLTNKLVDQQHVCLFVTSEKSRLTSEKSRPMGEKSRKKE
jgi:hypothetical protein